MKGLDCYPQDSSFPWKGLNTITPSTQLSIGYSPRMLNVVIEDGIIKTRAGIEQLGSTFTSNVVFMKEFEISTGTKILVLATATRLFYRDADANTYIDITPRLSADTVASGDKPTKTIVIAGSDLTTRYTAGTLVELTGANAGIYTVASSSYSAPDTSVVFVETPPSTDFSATEALVLDELTAGDWIDSAEGWATIGGVTDRYFILVNGAAKPVYYNGTGYFQYMDLSAAGINTAKTVCVLGNYLFLGHIIDSSDDPQPHQYAYSDAQRWDTFDGDNSGIVIIADLVNGIELMKPLGNSIVVYTKDEIEVGSPQSSSFGLFYFQKVNSNLSLLSPRCIITERNFHLIATEMDILQFDGSSITNLTNTTIRNLYSAYINIDARLQSFAQVDAKRDRYYFFISSQNPFPQTCFVFEDGTWTVQRFNSTATSASVYAGTFVLRWNSASVKLQTWADMGSATWTDMQTEVSGYTNLLALGTRVGEASTGDLYDVGGIFASYVDLPDFEIPFHDIRVLEVEFEASGSSLTVFYSTDKGTSVTSLGSVSVTSNMARYRLKLNARTRYISFKFLGNFNLQFVRIWYKKGSPRYATT